MIWVLGRMFILACGGMAKMYIWDLIDHLSMEYQLWEENLWPEFYSIFPQSWHL